MSLYNEWIDLLTKNGELLAELEAGLLAEKQALLDNQIDALRGACLIKEKATRKIEILKSQITHLKKKSVIQFGLSDTVALSQIFDRFETEQSHDLNDRRLRQLRVSRKINHLNRFNNSCVGTYMEEVNGMQSLLSLLTGDLNTYGSDGATTQSRSGGYLLRRSF